MGVERKTPMGGGPETNFPTSRKRRNTAQTKLIQRPITKGETSKGKSQIQFDGRKGEMRDPRGNNTRQKEKTIIQCRKLILCLEKKKKKGGISTRGQSHQGTPSKNK